MAARMPIYLGEEAVEKFLEFCKNKGFENFFLVADESTFKALGRKVLDAIQDQNWDVRHIILDPHHLHTNELSLTRVFAACDGQPRLFVAVGSGTITDITRFTSHRSGNPFVSFPTAASVDAYTSKSSSVTIAGLKKSYYGQIPAAIFTDMPVICDSPSFLTASGFGDSISKFTSTSDWKITNMVWDAPFDEDIYQSGLEAARQTSGAVESIQQADVKGMTAIMESQFKSGFTMSDFGESTPASGGEHHIAHVWDMMFHWEGREGLFHGNAVGVAMIFEAQWFEKLRDLTKEEVKQLLDRTIIPSREDQEKQLREQLPVIAEKVIAADPIYMQLSDPQVLDKIKQRLLDNWEQIQAVAENVPPAQQIMDWLKMVGAPTTPADLGISEEQVEIALENGLYLRERFSMNIIRKLLGW